MSGPDRVRVFAPASVSNVACGFDVLGFAIEGPGDTVEVQRSERTRVEIGSITGDGGRLPRDPRSNTATVAAQAVLDRRNPEEPRVGIRLDIHKHMPTSSGLGSSAASAVAAVVAVDALLGSRLPLSELLVCALEGERLASGTSHADNLAPALYGGLTLVRALEPQPDVVSLPVPEGLACAVVRPEVEIETRASRQRLGERVALADAVTQWGNVGALVAALFRGDLELLARSLHDAIAEPVRAREIPGFLEVKAAALEAGALGCSLSGSGPAIFALCAEHASAVAVGRAMVERLRQVAALSCDLYVSAVGAPGAHPVE